MKNTALRAHGMALFSQSLCHSLHHRTGGAVPWLLNR